MTVVFTKPVEFVPVTFKDYEVFLSLEIFNSMSMARAQRISAKIFYNTGPLLVDEFAIKGEQLALGGNVTALELDSILNISERREAEQLFGEQWTHPKNCVTEPNPEWE